MKDERVLRMGIGNLDVEVEGFPLPTPKGQVYNQLSPESSDIVSSSSKTELWIIIRRTLTLSKKQVSILEGNARKMTVYLSQILVQLALQC